MAKPLRVGIISAKWGVQCHLPAWRAVDGIEVVAICTAHRETAERAAREHGIAKAYWDYRALAADPDVDLIDVGTRPPLRYEMAKAAIEAGKHVYVGVPYAATVDQAEELTRLAAEKGVMGASDSYFEHMPVHREMKRRIDAGELGELYSISLDMQINIFNPPRINFDYWWFADPANGASALRNFGSHSLTLLVALFGDVQEAIGREKLFLKQWRSAQGEVFHPQVPDTVNALLQLECGAIATVNISWVAAGGVGWRLDAYGSRGRLTSEHPAGFPNTPATRLLLGRSAQGAFAPTSAHVDLEEIALPRETTHSPSVAIDHTFEPVPSYPMALSFLQLKEAIEGRGRPSPDLGRALHVESVIAAIARSQTSHCWEPIAS